jgi:hypothetical protein
MSHEGWSIVVTVARSTTLRLTWEDDGQNLIVINIRDGRIFRLNKSAGKILERLPIQFDTVPRTQQEFIQDLIKSGLAEPI